MAHRRPTHSESTYNSGSTSRSSYRGDRGDRMDRSKRQGRMNDFSYETRGHRPTEEYFSERQMSGSNYDSRRQPADYYSGRGGYAQDRYENASRQEFDRYNRDHENRYFDEDYEGNRGFNRNYDMHSDYDNYGRQSQSRRPYDEEHRAYGRNQPPQRMNRDREHSSEDFYTSDRNRNNYDQGYNDQNYSDRYNRQNNNDNMRYYGGPETDWHDQSYGGSEQSRGVRGRNRPDYY